jgi:replicative DNA helicase
VSVTDDARPVEPRLAEPRPVETRAGEPQYDRSPPQDVAAEQCVLGGMLLSKDAIADVLEILKAGDFYRPPHATIFDAILDLYGRGEPADPITVAAALADAGQLARVGGAPYLHTLIASVPTAANAAYYARIVSERAVLRRLIEAGTRIVQLGYGSAAGAGRDVDELVDLAQQAVYDVSERRVSEDFAILSDLLQPTLDEIEAVGSQGGVMTGVPTGFTDLDRLLNGLHPGQLIVVAGRPGLGKALALDTPLPTPDGWTTMGEVTVGSQLIGADGRPTSVVHVFEIMHSRPCFEVEFSDGTVIVADAEHLWKTTTHASRRQRAETKPTCQWPQDARAVVTAVREAAARAPDSLVTTAVHPAVVTTAEIAASLRHPADGRLNHAVENCQPLSLPHREDLPIPPYTLGLWLGDGHAGTARFTTADTEIIGHVEADGFRVRPGGRMVYTILPPELPPMPDVECVVCGTRFKPRRPSVRTCGRRCGGRSRGLVESETRHGCATCGKVMDGPRAGRRCAACYGRYGSFVGYLRAAGTLDHKHIPLVYLRASEAQRRSLLAGLLDADGTAAASGNVQLTVTSQRLAADARELIVSLGYRCSMTTRAVKGRTSATSTAYTLTFTTVDEVFRLGRKRIAHQERRRSTSTARTGSRFIVDVRPVPSVPVRCITVDNDDHLYLAGRSMVPTHNSTAAMDFARATSVRHNMGSAIFSLEMSKVEIVMRLLAAEARVPLHVLRSGQLSDDDWTKLARRMGEISEAPLFVDDTPNMSLMEIRAKSRRLKQRHDLKLIIVDYLQLMTSPKRVESRQQEVAELSRGLKLLAKEVDCPVVAVSQLNRGPEQRTDKRPQLSDLRESGCLTAGTRVLRADTNEEVTLAELLTSGARDVPVWALDERLRYSAHTLTHVFPSGRRQVFRMRLSSGKEIEATANHPFLTYDGWRRLDGLPIGARLAVPRHVPSPLNVREWPDDEVIMLAHLLGDGSFVPHQPIRYASRDEENLTAVALAAKQFGITAIRDEYAAARVTTLRLPAPFRLARGRRNPIAEWLDGMRLFGCRSHEKFIPGPVFSLPKRQLALFVRHLWATDGSVTLTAGGGGGRVYYASTSRRLLDGLSRLLLRFGISSRIRTVKSTRYRPQFTLDISGRDDQLRFLREIGVHGERARACVRLRQALEGSVSNPNVDTVPREVWSRVREILADRGMSHRQFSAAIGTQFCGSVLWKHAPSRQRLTRVAAVLDAADLELMATNDVFWDEVVAVEPLGEQEVFDATVLGVHNFIANGIATHNSIEQDADVVILLHRDDYYDKESPRAGEADFIVAKHRNGPTDTVTVAAQLHLSRFVDMAVV